MSTALGGFDKVTAVQRNGPGRYRARVDPAWDGPGSPLGGVGAATILRAMLAELAAAEFAPRSVTVHFSRPLVHGAAEIQVETLRRGHHLATVQAHTLQEGILRCAALATFGQPFRETATWEADPASSTTAGRKRRGRPPLRAGTTHPAPTISSSVRTAAVDRRRR